MSSYTSLKVKLKTKCSLSEQDINTIMEKTSSDCGVGSHRTINKDSIDLNITFNHGLYDMIGLIGLLEKFIDYPKVTVIGDFKSEDIWGLQYPSVLAYKDKIFTVNVDIREGFVQQNLYFISDLREKREHYSLYVDNNVNEDEKEEEFIKEFLKSSYGIE